MIILRDTRNGWRYFSVYMSIAALAMMSIYFSHSYETVFENKIRMLVSSTAFTYNTNRSVKADSNINLRFEKVHSLLDRLWENSETDYSHAYRFVPNVVAPPTNGNEFELPGVTLCTQATFNHLHYVEELAAFWKGPISVSIFSPPEDIYRVLHAILRIRNCHELVKQYVQFHIAYATTQTPPWQYSDAATDSNMSDIQCNSSISNSNIGQPEITNYEHEFVYPHNLLRTISIKYAYTTFVMLIDIDLVPSENLHSMLQTFLKTELSNTTTADSERIAYVLPCFEYDSKSFAPLNKAQILHLWPDKVQPFYIESCRRCHKNTNYTRWLELEYTWQMNVAYLVDWKYPWEPFYVARRSGLPVFDAMFKNFGFNRVSQMCEMYIAGYTFAVLNNGFLVHRGMKHKKVDRKLKNEVEHLFNKGLYYDTFLVELKTRYPNSNRTCDPEIPQPVPEQRKGRRKKKSKLLIEQKRKRWKRKRRIMHLKEAMAKKENAAKLNRVQNKQ